MNQFIYIDFFTIVSVVSILMVPSKVANATMLARLDMSFQTKIVYLVQKSV